ncbi:MAG TPA: RDD family protein [Gaiellaceae bacterium]|jgi:uncharacterized RDD family membrane protein YckC
MRLHHIALGPVRAASRTGRGVLADEAERAIEAALGGPLPEIVGRALVERRVAERVVSAMVEAAGRTDGTHGASEDAPSTRALERWIRGEEAGRLVEAAADRVMQSTAFRRSVAEMLSSPEIHRALSRGARGFGADAARALRRRARAVDGRVEARAHALLRRPSARAGFAGFGTRGVALVLDAALVQAAFLLASASLALVLALVGGLRPGWLAGSLAGAGWLLIAGVYFVGCWSGAGQTPGLRLMHLRVVTGSGASPSVPRALLRFVGLICAIVPLCAGFLPALVDGRRRVLQDFLAGTAVIYEPPRASRRRGNEGWAR